MSDTPTITAPNTSVVVARRRGILPQLLSQPVGAFGCIVGVILLVLLLFAPHIAPHGFAEQNISMRLQGPSWDYWLGTDQLGRDILSRIVVGAQIEMLVAVPAVFGGLVLGLVLGVPAGYLGGWFDACVLIVLDALHALPTVVLALTLLALMGNSMVNIVLVLAVSLAPSFARVARASVLSARQSAYVEAELVLGASTARILVKHILPNIIPPLLILMAIHVPSAIAVETGLSFLGLGVRPPTPSWGVILADGFDRVRTSPWAVIWTCFALGITTLGFTLLGESLRDILDPRLRTEGET